jgi:hypothetical protein
MEENTIDAKLYDLVITKEYTQLSQKELEFVNSHTDEIGYNAMRILISTSLKIDSPNPSKHVRENLLLAFKAKNKRNRFIDRVHELCSYKIELYKPALALCLILLVFIIYKTKQQIPGPTIEYITKIDTLFLPTANVPDTNKLISSNYKPVKRDSIQKVTSSENQNFDKVTAPTQLQNYDVHISDIGNFTGGGNSLQEDTVIAGFIVGLN